MSISLAYHKEVTNSRDDKGKGDPSPDPCQMLT